MESKLNCKIKTIIEVDYNDLEQFIKEETGNVYDIVAHAECGNDVNLSFNKIDSKINFFGKEDWEIFKKNGIGTSLSDATISTILNGLCSEGKIPPGDYLVKVSW